jgi:hypothetical protein
MHKSRIASAAALAALAILAACNSEPEAISVNRFDPQAEALKNAAPVAPPPMIVANRTYRCRPDNSLYYVSFLSNNSANVRTTEDGIPEMLNSEDADGPYTGEGLTISGNGETVTINGKSCHT